MLDIGQDGVATCRRSVESVLGQTLADVELIIVDDSGNLDVAAWLRDVQRDDARVAVLSRQQSVGIPALGWSEAAMRARADYFIFARAGDLFEANALKLLAELTRRKSSCVCYGYVESLESGEGGETRVRSDSRAQPLVTLRVSNFIARHSVIVPRHIVSAIGLPDPHILLSEAADWDYWRRIADHLDLQPVDVCIGLSGGTAAEHPNVALDAWAVEEWMRTPRNARLLPQAIGEYDITTVDSTTGRLTQEVCADLARRSFGQRASLEWQAERIGAVTQEDDGYVLVVNVQYDASTTLCFDMLPPPLVQRVRVITHGPNISLFELARASALVLIRRLRAFSVWVDVAKTLGIPVYYFLDDNMPYMLEQGEAQILGEDFRLEPLRQDLAGCAGVLLSSMPLVEYFREHSLHPALEHFPVACADQKSVHQRFSTGGITKSDSEITFALTGGLHRSPVTQNVIMPALMRLAGEGRAIHVIAPALGTSSESVNNMPPSMRLTLLPYDYDYAAAMRRFGQLGPHFMVVAPSKTRNNRYKTQHALLTARLLDAVAILPRIEPYHDIEDGSVAMIVDPAFDEEGWYNAFERAVDGAVDMAAIRSRNIAYCAQAFSAKLNAQVLSRCMQAGGGAVTWEEQYRRQQVIAKTGHLNSTQPGSAQDRVMLRNAEELNEYRRMRRYSWRHRLLARPSDLWNYCGTAYWPLQRDSLDNGWRTKGATLEYSDSLHELPCREYRVRFPECVLEGLAFAVSADCARSGSISVQLIHSSNTTVARVTRELARIDSAEPVRFVFDPIKVTDGEEWRIRVSCRSRAPVYLYEFINRRVLGTLYASPSPFMTLLTTDDERKVQAARSVASLTSVSVNVPGQRGGLNVVFVIDGDIPTNHIIGRLIADAVTADGTLTTLTLPEFKPDALPQGAVIILSRIASSAAVPMLDWLKQQGIPYAYYIDDNFWELSGDHPVAQYYRCAPVRQALDKAIKNATTVIVNAALLGDYIKARYRNAKITFLNPPFDFSLIAPGVPAAKKDGEIRVGFAGSVTRAEDFNAVVPALQRLLDAYSFVNLVFFGYCPPELLEWERVTYVPHVGNYEKFIRLKQTYLLDVGLAPLGTNKANAYKTNNKYREYSALKIAGIYTNASPYQETVVDGETGLLVKHDSDSWLEALRRLVTDEALRMRIAKNAYADVQANYAQTVVVEQWRTFLLDFANRYARLATISHAPATVSAGIALRRWLAHSLLRLSIFGRRTVVRGRRRLKRAKERRGAHE
ncbi:glycosyltransferase [Mycetohabitans endofungorum]